MIDDLKRARKHFSFAMAALGRSYRSGAHTATSAKHRADYERHREAAEAAIDAAIAKAEGRS